MPSPTRLVSPRVLIIGIDGGSFDTIDPLLDAGALPNLAGLLRDAASSRTACTWPAHTAPGWSTFVSASHPGQHGIFQFFDVQDAGYRARVTQSWDLGRSSVWDWMAAQGWSLGLINVPMSHPPADLPGYQVTWPLTQTLRHCHPPGLLRELAVSGAHFQSDLATMFTGDLSYLESAERNVAARVRSVRHLMTTRPTDAVMVVLTEADRVGHHYWHFADPTHPHHEQPPAGTGWDQAMARILGAIDEAVGELLELVDEETTVVLVSDHGLGTGRYGFAVHTVLEEAGLLTTVAAEVPENGVASWFAEGGRRIDFDRTLLYLPVPGVNSLNINERGRQLRGIVDPAERDRVVAEAVDVLAGLHTPDGTALFQAVLPRAEAYPGPLSHRAPDILLQPADETVLVTPELTGPRFRPSQQTGLHRHQGIWAQRSARLAPGRRPGQMPLVDAVPTMLADVGLALPDDVAGKCRDDLRDGPSGGSKRAARPFGHAPARSRGPAATALAEDEVAADEEVFTTNILRTMGYL
jgi:predicted AlkP superfamily phosphohydrolase/phosphomutase